MSHFSEVEIDFTDEKCLVEALKKLGFTDIEIHQEAQNLYGYHGDVREQKANIIIRRKHIGSASNDIGFIKQDNGKYKAYISQFDQRKYNDTWIGKLKQEYGVEKAKKEARAKGYLVKEERLKDNTVRLTLRRS